ncbi:aminoacyl-tRNA hydrolase [Actinopolyspora mortivallis]|uniref:aminoacyl-tRNA hydrolase n=1 Tax=Actinopolyspora mortivallis TaxID=33906 RepID=UPI0003619AF7|nr:aminoacyl-tRNA hydrolase [Actinopolyspora mortivallis]
MTPPDDNDAGRLALVFGLGNPGPRYAGNRHNIGFLVADELAGRLGSGFKRHKSGADIAEGRLDGSRVAVAKSRSLMNLSGGPVAAAARFYKVPPESVIVIHDELDLPYGRVRLKRGGGENGHNGLRSISRSLGTRDYLRVRFGVDRPPGRMDPADYVLRDFSKAERAELGYFVDHCADAVRTLATKGLEAAQNEFH